VATTPAGARLTAEHQAEQLAVRARTLRGLIELWRTVDPEDLAGTIGVFTRAATLLSTQGFAESSAAAATYFIAYRAAEGALAPAAVVAAAAFSEEETAGGLRGAALSGIIKARRRGLTLEQAGRNGLVRVAGQLIKQVLAGGRMTIIGSTLRDPVALGWARVTTGDPCAFCRMLASRGPVYKSKKGAGFEPHDVCGCTPEAVYPGDPLDSGSAAQAKTYLAEYTTAQAWARSSGTMSSGTSNDALNNYRRWLAHGSPEPG
jgi:hypothetical protein